jgi:HAD superfamily hydrolase (TIGR01484 family)
MRYLALAADYDGTLAHDGQVDEKTVMALERLLATGRKLILVTGRELDQLLSIFRPIHLFDWVVAENGALLYHPRSREQKLLAERSPKRLIQLLRARGVEPLSVGKVIIATQQPHERTVLDTIRDLGLEQQIIFNKGAVMILPSGVTKATGLSAALDAMGLSRENVVAVGDAENDHAFLRVCGCSVAVANALPALKEHADLVTRAEHGAGVAELIERLISDDLAACQSRPPRGGQSL